jgi:hypothetical protein
MELELDTKLLPDLRLELLFVEFLSLRLLSLDVLESMSQKI